MIGLIHDIDTALSQCDAKIKSYGLARLIDDKGSFYPSAYTQDGSQGEKITPNDRYKVITYHRLLDAGTEDSETFSFGRSYSRMMDQRVRLVVIVDIKYAETFIDGIIDALPGKIVNDDYRYAEVGSNISLSKDTRAIWSAEWSNAYEDKVQMRYRLYAIEYSLNYMPCECGQVA